jgi:hypothetical protein
MKRRTLNKDLDISNDKITSPETEILSKDDIQCVPLNGFNMNTKTYYGYVASDTPQVAAPKKRYENMDDAREELLDPSSTLSSRCVLVAKDVCSTGGAKSYASYTWYNFFDGVLLPRSLCLPGSKIEPGEGNKSGSPRVHPSYHEVIGFYSDEPVNAYMDFDFKMGFTKKTLDDDSFVRLYEASKKRCVELVRLCLASFYQEVHEQTSLSPETRSSCKSMGLFGNDPLDYFVNCPWVTVTNANSLEARKVSYHVVARIPGTMFLDVGCVGSFLERCFRKNKILWKILRSKRILLSDTESFKLEKSPFDWSVYAINALKRYVGNPSTKCFRMTFCTKLGEDRPLYPDETFHPRYYELFRGARTDSPKDKIKLEKLNRSFFFKSLVTFFPPDNTVFKDAPLYGWYDNTPTRWMVTNHTVNVLISVDAKASCSSSSLSSFSLEGFHVSPRNRYINVGFVDSRLEYNVNITMDDAKRKKIPRSRLRRTTTSRYDREFLPWTVKLNSKIPKCVAVSQECLKAYANMVGAVAQRIATYVNTPDMCVPHYKISYTSITLLDDDTFPRTREQVRDNLMFTVTYTSQSKYCLMKPTISRIEEHNGNHVFYVAHIGRNGGYWKQGCFNTSCISKWKNRSANEVNVSRDGVGSDDRVKSLDHHKNEPTKKTKAKNKRANFKSLGRNSYSSSSDEEDLFGRSKKTEYATGMKYFLPPNDPSWRYLKQVLLNCDMGCMLTVDDLLNDVTEKTYEEDVQETTEKNALDFKAEMDRITARFMQTSNDL